MNCQLCPRRCGKRPGYCGAGECARVFRWGPHFGEEPPLTGEHGSGCVFFSRCTMRCVYCQNSPWSWRGAGEDKTVDGLKAILRTLAVEDQCENWNLVSPTPYLPFIREAAAGLKSEGVKLPFVWNSSGYERVETLREYRELCDFALFDLRYASDATALKYSAAPNYVATARAALECVAGELCGLDRTICRILVLPGHHEEAIENLAWVAATLGPDAMVSVMAQYTPAYLAQAIPPLDRKVTAEEYAEVAEAAEDFGLVRGWVQDLAAADPELALLGENMGAGHGPVK